MTKPIRIVLVEDHELMRAGIRSLLQYHPEIVIVAEAAEGAEALNVVEQHQPDIVLMDIKIAGLNGLDVTAQLKQRWPHIRVIMLSMHAGEEYVLKAVRAGATGYLLKDSSPGELTQAITAVVQGEFYLSQAVSKHIANDYMRQSSPLCKVSGPRGQLTPRQREILQLIGQGCSTKEVAWRLGISQKTVHTHRAQIMDRLDIHDVAGLVRYAIQNKLVTLDE